MTGPIALLAFVVAMVAAPAFALDPPSVLASYTRVSWTEQDGMPVGQSYAIAQDQQGYLWLGSPEGLVRFDGFRFLLWQAPIQPSLPSGEITSLCAAGDGSLWIGFIDRVGISRIRHGTLQNYGAQTGLSEGFGFALVETSDGTIWAGGLGGLARFRDDRWEKLGKEHGLPGQATVRALYQDRRRNLWVGTSVGVFRRTDGSNAFQHVASLPLVRGFSEDAGGTIWITDPVVGWRRLEGPNARHNKLLRKPANGQALLHDRHGHLWVATSGDGLFRVQSGAGTVPSTVERITEQDGLTGNVVWSLLEDREGNLWAVTPGGLNRLSPKQSSFVLPLELATDFVTTVTSDKDGSVWVGTTNGLVRVSGSQYHRYAHPDPLASTVVTALHTDQGGALWAALEGDVVQFIDGRFSRVQLPPRSSPHMISALSTDHRGVLWLCDSRGGVFRLSDRVLSPVQELGSAQCISILTDTKGRVWLGFRGGDLFMYREGTFRRYSTLDGIDGSSVYAIYEDKRGRIWVRTRRGLSRLHKDTFVTMPSTTLPIATLGAGIVEDEDGYLWVGISSGVVRISPTELDSVAANPSHSVSYNLYDAADGVGGPGVTTAYPTTTRDGDGRLWLVTGSGVAVVAPRHLTGRLAPVSVGIDTVIVNGRKVSDLTKLEVSAGPSTLQIEYGALSLSAPDKLRFRYKLEGFDSNWLDVGRQHRAYYMNLPAGNYRFRVMATNTGGAWTESTGFLDLSVRPLFYQTIWFYTAGVLMVAVATATGWRLRLRQIRTRHALLLAERGRMARELHDTLLQSLAGVAVHLDVIARKVESLPSHATEELRRTRRLVEQQIRETRRSIWDLRSTDLERRPLPLALREIGERLAEDHAVDFSMVVNGTPVPCAPWFEDQLLRIGQEAVANAVRHGLPTQVRVELSYSGSSAVLRVSDDGCGFNPDADAPNDTEHFGLLSMRERARQLGARFTLMSAAGQGTTVEIDAPLQLEKGA